MIKVVALSCAGTITYREERKGKNRFDEPFRYGLSEFFEGCRERDIAVCFTSRNPSWQVQHEITAHIQANPKDNSWWRTGARIGGYYTAPGTPKDFSRLLDEENINPDQLLVIESNIERGIEGAKKIGAHYQTVKPYITPFDWGNLGYGLKEGFKSIIPMRSDIFGDVTHPLELRTIVPVHLPVLACA